MVFKVHSNKKAAYILLKLLEDGSGGVTLTAVDKEGNVDKHILHISKKGTLYRYKDLPSRLGLALDSTYKNIVDDENYLS